MENQINIELEKKQGDITSFEAWKAVCSQRRGVIVDVSGIKRYMELPGIRNLIADFGKTLLGRPLGSDYHMIFSDADLTAAETGLYLEGDTLVIKTDVFGEIKPLTREDLEIITFLFERRTVFLTDDYGASFPAIELERRAA